MKEFEIRADYKNDTLVVYQAYNKVIAKAALENQKFTAPFSFNRMTWIKPSFLWMMERSNYGQKPNQEYTLALHIKREAWEKALELAILTSPEKRAYPNPKIWEEEFENANVYVQWDPERNIKGTKLNYRSIQVGISRHLIEEFNEDWIVKIEDYNPLVKKILNLTKSGEFEKAKKLLPVEKNYPLSGELARRIGADI
ncbi:DUF4291 domain-containing protein [Chryseobacterium lactis]|uniref:DUF4291 domain-containing protein n=1 Tax=Chryseobacterium lactis TaxID=1241981 RepID=A0A3G6RN76_CHRLC|nr:DUF4291 domain-containing protein [Chryseobacterium lactis]AZA81346.1 DUF4291 domain-containing protein [Chryseobacterium lactis]AZB06345.1 DUF4291 domain-containing protein [Chryseobacterium lactis]PNW15198.1 DUF4291 domain-containing protein [Chryseobacterium lactis]